MLEVEKDSRIPFINRKNKKRIMIIALSGLLLAGSGVWAYQTWFTSPSAAAMVRVQTVKRGDVTETVSASGTVQASKRVSLAAPSGGEAITALYVKVGDHVKAGQVLATLDDTKAKVQLKEAEANLASARAKLAEATKKKTAAEMKTLEANVNQAKAALETAKSGYDTQKARNDLEKAKAALQTAQKTYNTQKTLYEQGFISKNEFDQAKASLDDAQIAYDNAVLQHNQAQGQAGSTVEQAQAAYETAVQALNDAKAGPDAATVQSAQASVVQAEAQLMSAQKALQELTVKAPMDGVIVTVNGNVGEVPSSPFIEMDNSDSGNLEVLADISESDIGKVKEGLSATFTSNSYSDKEFTGKVTLVYPEAKTESGVTTYQVLLSVDNKENLLKTGMTVNITIEVGTHRNVLVVPPAALKTQNGRDGVYVAVNGSSDSAAAGEGKNALPYRFQPVTIGYYASDKVEITSGLNEGDQIVMMLNPSSSTSSNRGQTNGMGGFPGFGGQGMGGPVMGVQGGGSRRGR
ncbi:efflux RND transporter periplasmic adaptor subunit [Brevibacillus sp. SYP-B805]|uniref:efflux RND transporter periplasmic adaptor subunit n=1 Tax=Brevibacillus sp. SYP-B805 TaxID=1578199 RepID=UPI0013EBE996|nr:efflux RND transporter periplasmic adaptor subunit [Brevibacillus sp. SYP-B805]NGQ94924.1 efflux RND transporter periplasmic adaptor subunit [Brevibacillus sp. SYP-B805]